LGPWQAACSCSYPLTRLTSIQSSSASMLVSQVMYLPVVTLAHFMQSRSTSASTGVSFLCPKHQTLTSWQSATRWDQLRMQRGGTSTVGTSSSAETPSHPNYKNENALATKMCITSTEHHDRTVHLSARKERHNPSSYEGLHLFCADTKLLRSSRWCSRSRRSKRCKRGTGGRGHIIDEEPGYVGGIGGGG
jgi:hypothetical protein